MRRMSRLRQPLAASSSPSPSATHGLASTCSPIASFRAPSTTRTYHHARPQPPAIRPCPPPSTRLGRFYATKVETAQADAVEADAAVSEIPESLQDGLEAIPDPRQQLGGGLFVTPPPRTRAEHQDEVVDPSYVPATKDTGLKAVGGLKRWWEDPKHWKVDFVGFKPKSKMADPEKLEAAVRRAVVEALALQNAGRHEDLLNAWPLGGADEARASMTVTLSANTDGTAVLGQDVANVISALESAPDVASGGADALAAYPLSATEYRDSWDKSWKNISLADPRLKFAVTKRVFQLTGHRISDAKLPGIHSVASLLGAVLTPPKPKTVTSEVQTRLQDLVELPNMKVASKRVTRGDKEKALGRYKLIEAELKKRDLPLDGHGGAEKSKELDWLRGR